MSLFLSANNTNVVLPENGAWVPVEFTYQATMDEPNRLQLFLVGTSSMPEYSNALTDGLNNLRINMSDITESRNTPLEPETEIGVIALSFQRNPQCIWNQETYYIDFSLRPGGPTVRINFSSSVSPRPERPERPDGPYRP